MTPKKGEHPCTLTFTLELNKRLPLAEVIWGPLGFLNKGVYTLAQDKTRVKNGIRSRKKRVKLKKK